MFGNILKLDHQSILQEFYMISWFDMIFTGMFMEDLLRGGGWKYYNTTLCETMKSIRH